MEITTQSYIGLHVIIIEGVVNQEAFDTIKATLQQVPQGKAKQLWIDCSHLQRIRLSNTCIGTFVDKLLELRKTGTEIVLFGMNPFIERLFRLLKLETVFRQVTTLADAYLLVNEREKIQEPE